MLQVTKDTLIEMISTSNISMGGFVVCGVLAVTICAFDRFAQMLLTRVNA